MRLGVFWNLAPLLGTFLDMAGVTAIAECCSLGMLLTRNAHSKSHAYPSQLIVIPVPPRGALHRRVKNRVSITSMPSSKFL